MIETVLYDRRSVVRSDDHFHLALRVAEISLKRHGRELVRGDITTLVTEEWREEVGKVDVVPAHKAHQNPAT